MSQVFPYGWSKDVKGRQSQSSNKVFTFGSSTLIGSPATALGDWSHPNKHLQQCLDTNRKIIDFKKRLKIILLKRFI